MEATRLDDPDTLAEDNVSEEAPFGYDNDGKPSAPYGYTATGRVKKDNRGRPSKTGAKTGPPPAPKSNTRPAGGASTRRKNYTETIEGALHIVLAPAAILAPLDAAPFMDASADLAKAGNALAQHYPVFGEFCAKMLIAGPVGLALGALLPPLAQVFENHGWAPPHVTSMFGAVPADQYAQRLADKIERMRAGAGVPTQAPADHTSNGYQHAPAAV